MLKFALKDAALYLRLSSQPYLGKFFEFQLDQLPGLKDPEIAATLYRRHRVSGRITKETAPGRFQSLEPSMLQFLGSGSQEIHDVAVSSGITSLELFQYLKANNIEFKLNISDKYSRYYAQGSIFRRIYGVDKQLIQGYLFGILADEKVSWNFPISKILFSLLPVTPNEKVESDEIPLYDPHLFRMIQLGEVKEIFYDLVATEISEQFTFVRCMNVLNFSYFPNDQIRIAIRLLTNSLRPSGILLLGRTGDQGKNTATYYRKTNDGGLELILDVLGGSELKDLVKSMEST